MSASTSEPGTAGRSILLILLALLVTAAVHVRGLSGGFVYDDHLTVERHPAIASAGEMVASLGKPMWEFSAPQAESTVGYWRPLANVALYAGHALSGGEPIGFHALSILFHLLATWTAFRLARRLTQSPPIAFFTALMFGLHPVHVEAVSWISAINEPMSGLFVLLALDAWLAWRERGSAGTPWLAGTWFLLAILSKELALAVVPLAIAIDLGRWVGKRATEPFPRGWRAYVPFLLVLVLWYVARAFVFGGVAAGFDRTTTEFGVTLTRLLLLRVELLGDALMLLAWPADLRVFHPFVPAASWASIGPAFVACAAWTALVVVAWKRRSGVALTAALFVPVAIAPMLGRVQALGLFPFSERYLYVAVFGIALLASLEAWRLLPRSIALLVLLAIAIALGRRTFDRIGVWRDDRTLLDTAVAEAPRSPYVHRVLGKALLEEYVRTNDPDTLRRAFLEFQAALDLGLAAQKGDETVFAASADFLQSNIGLALSLLYETDFDPQRDFSAPIDILKMVVERYPASPEAWTALGIAHIGAGDVDAAQTAIEKALAIDPRYVEAISAKGQIWMRRGDWDKARASFEEALRLRPDHVPYLRHLVGANERAGDDKATAAAIARGLAVAPDDARLRVMRGNLLAKQGDLDAALREFNEVLLRVQSSAPAWLGKGKVLGAKGEKTGALYAFQQAAEFDTTSFEAHYNAGALLLADGNMQAAMPYLVRAYEHRGNSPAGRSVRDTLEKLPIQSAETFVLLATSDADRGDADGALKWLERAFAIDKENGPALFLQGGMLKQKGDKDGALRAWKRACDVLPDSLLAAKSTGDLLAEMGNREEARAYLSRALAIAEKAAAGSVEARQAIPILKARIEDLGGSGQ